MKKIPMVLLCAFLSVCVGISYSAENKKTDSTTQTQKSSQEARPILPPVVSPGASGVSPTPSPHITAPDIMPQSISASSQVSTQIPITDMQNIPSIPTYASTPNVPVPTVLPQVPIVGNVIGKVIAIGPEKNGMSWIEVNDDLFGEVARIDIKDLKNIQVLKQAKGMSFKDIKIRDTVNIIFTNQNNENIANFINILTEEELKMLREGGVSDLTVTQEQ